MGMHLVGIYLTLIFPINQYERKGKTWKKEEEKKSTSLPLQKSLVVLKEREKVFLFIYKNAF